MYTKSKTLRDNQRRLLVGVALSLMGWWGSSVHAAPKTITVAADGSGDYKTIQEAVAAVPDDNADRTVIHIKAGTYQGPVVVPKTKTNVTFEGESTEKTILTYDKNAQEPRPEGAHIFNPNLNVMGNDFHAERLTIQNTSGDHGQALAMRGGADRLVMDHCRLLGWQDTLLLDKGRYYFNGCYIEGRVDFIYGEGTAVFDHCEIHSKNGGFVTAASTPQDNPYGFVFLNCRLTGDPAPWVDPTGKIATKPSNNPKADLGRPWRPYASVIYINCEMGDHISPEGWNNWGNPENEKTARYSEYHSTGPGANPSQRVPWSKQLTKEDAAKITIKAVLGGTDNWDPASAVAAPVAKPSAELNLWPGNPPGMVPGATPGADDGTGRYRNVGIPGMLVYLPDMKPAGKGRMAIIVCPGGGYTHLTRLVGADGAVEAFVPQGVAIISLKYRLLPPSTQVEADAREDGKRAVRLVRSHAAEWGIDPHKIGVLGWSAGANLALNTATHFDNGAARASDPVERQSSRPDFVVLLSPWPNSHTADAYPVPRNAPPAFIGSAKDDTVAPVTFTEQVAANYQKASPKSSLWIVDTGGHGAFTIDAPGEGGNWIERFWPWLKSIGIQK